MGYKVAKEDLEYLSEKVKKRRDLTQLACKEKIMSFKNDFNPVLSGINYHRSIFIGCY